MDWQKACMESKYSRARRSTQDGRWVIRDWSGKAITQTHNKREIRDAYHHEIEGFLDWEPYGGTDKVAVKQQA